MPQQLCRTRFARASTIRPSISLGIGAWECELETERLTWTPGVHDIFGYPIGQPAAAR